MVNRKTLLDADISLLITSHHKKQRSSRSLRVGHGKDMGRQGDKQGQFSGTFSGWLVSEFLVSIQCLARRWRPVVALLRCSGGGLIGLPHSRSQICSRESLDLVILFLFAKYTYIGS